MGEPDLGEQLQRYRVEALAAQEAGDLGTAIAKLKLARTAIALAPDSELRQLSRLEWDRNAIQRLIDDLERDRVTAINAASTDVKYTCLGAAVCDPEHADPLDP